MKFILFTILAIFVCVKETQALAKCPTVPTLDLERVNLDQVIKLFFIPLFNQTILTKLLNF